MARFRLILREQKFYDDALAESLDDVMDAVDASAHLFEQYQIAKVRDGARRFAHITVSTTEQMRVALQHTEERVAVTPSVVEINRLENEADRLHQDVVSTSFDDEKDPIAVIKWKKIYDSQEATVDRIEDVSDVIHGVILKRA